MEEPVWRDFLANIVPLLKKSGVENSTADRILAHWRIGFGRDLTGYPFYANFDYINIDYLGVG